uniref:Uncharacterized protein n=1 Tax=Panagrolaimus sp. ES5 TaxID=591445 RepID=A0AC34G4E8_9BILA
MLKSIGEGGYLEQKISVINLKEAISESKKYVADNTVDSNNDLNRLAKSRVQILIANILGLHKHVHIVQNYKEDLQEVQLPQEEIIERLLEYENAVVKLLCEQIDENGFKSVHDWPYTKTDCTLLSSAYFLKRFVRYLVAKKLYYNEEAFVNKEWQYTNVTYYRQFLKTKYKRQSALMKSQRCYLQGEKKASRKNQKITNEASLVSISSSASCAPAIGVTVSTYAK